MTGHSFERKLPEYTRGWSRETTPGLLRLLYGSWNDNCSLIMWLSLPSGCHHYQFISGRQRPVNQCSAEKAETMYSILDIDLDYFNLMPDAAGVSGVSSPGQTVRCRCSWTDTITRLLSGEAMAEDRDRSIAHPPC